MSVENEDKTRIWKSVETTPGTSIKEVSRGAYKFQTIDAQYQILQATKLWGPYGSDWGVKNETFTSIMTGANDVAAIIYQAIFYYPEGSFPINSDIRLNTFAKGNWKINGDFAKKVSTDAMTKGLSKLGFSADVFMGKFDGNKYDGIDSYEIDFLATEAEMNNLSDLEKKLRIINPDVAEHINKHLVKGLKSEKAKRLISRAEDLLKADGGENA